jgi:protein O-GlcNAc transferase
MDDEWIESLAKLRLADTLVKQGKITEAKRLYQEILDLNPNEGKALHGLAKLFIAEGNEKEAIKTYKHACEAEPRNPHYRIFLGSLYREHFFLKEAEACFVEALDIGVPLGTEEVLRLLGIVYQQMGRLKESLESYKQAFALDPYSAEIAYNIGVLYSTMADREQAMEYFQKATELDPLSTEIHNTIASHHYAVGDYEKARESFRQALHTNPDDLTARWGLALFLPIIYESEEEIQNVQSQWLKKVTELTDSISLNTSKEKESALETLLFHAGFYNGYQGGNVIEGQRLYGHLIRKIVSASFSDLPKLDFQKTDKIRIAFVSEHFRKHSVFKSHGQWITKLDRSRFDVSLFYLGTVVDEAVEELQDCADFFYQNNDKGMYRKLVSKIQARELDCIIYLDVGMTPIIQLLAALRLAPLQCTTWGHPITTGLETIDVYLSSALMEPSSAQEQYSEELVLLPNLSVSYPFPKIESKVQPYSFQETERFVFLNMQIYLKLLPQRDWIFPEIAKRQPAVQFHFIASLDKPKINEAFLLRLEKAFAKVGLAWKDFVVIHPSLTQAEFYGLLDKADAVLDSMDWSGFNTTMEACAMQKLVLTCPGKTFRSRHSYAINRLLGLDALIVEDEEAYIETALRLVEDAAFRKEQTAILQRNLPSIFEDESPVRALESWLLHRCR